MHRSGGARHGEMYLPLGGRRYAPLRSDTDSHSDDSRQHTGRRYRSAAQRHTECRPHQPAHTLFQRRRNPSAQPHIQRAQFRQHLPRPERCTDALSPETWRVARGRRARSRTPQERTGIYRRQPLLLYRPAAQQHPLSRAPRLSALAGHRPRLLRQPSDQGSAAPQDYRDQRAA